MAESVWHGVIDQRVITEFLATLDAPPDPTNTEQVEELAETLCASWGGRWDTCIPRAKAGYRQDAIDALTDHQPKKEAKPADAVLFA